MTFNRNELELDMRVEMMSGGFVLVYPHQCEDGNYQYRREVFVTPRKLMAKMKQVLDDCALAGNNE